MFAIANRGPSELPRTPDLRVFRTLAALAGRIGLVIAFQPVMTEVDRDNSTQRRTRRTTPPCAGSNRKNRCMKAGRLLSRGVICDHRSHLSLGWTQRSRGILASAKYRAEREGRTPAVNARQLGTAGVLNPITVCPQGVFAESTFSIRATRGGAIRVPPRAQHLAPGRRRIQRAHVPLQPALQPEKGFWHSVINQLRRLGTEGAIELTAVDNQNTCGIKSALHSAARRNGVPIGMIARRDKVYAWLAGAPMNGDRRPGRAPLTCRVCGREIKRPRVGASRQYVCAGKGGRLSDCQKIWRKARRSGISIEQAKRWFAKRKRLAQRNGVRNG